MNKKINMNNKKRIGISIYPEKVGKEETLDYIKESYKCGFRRIFANLLEINDDEKGKKTLGIISTCLKYAKGLGMEVIVDVNPSFYEAFNYDSLETEAFLKLGATGIRLDEDFRGDVESKLSQKILIELNASAGVETAKLTLEKGGNPKNIIACHNFYPQDFTGLDYNQFLKFSRIYKKNKIKVAAFVTLPRSQETVGPWTTNDGMPTIEEHRNATLSEQIRHMFAMDVVDDIIISQQGATKKQMNIVKELISLDSIPKISEYKKFGANTKLLETHLNKIKKESLNCIYELEDIQEMSDLEKFIVFEHPHKTRGDITSNLIRSASPRLFFRDLRIDRRESNKEFFEKGDVIILNDNYGRYNSEVHIVVKKVPNDGTRNYVGRIKNFDHILLKYNTASTRFKLIKKI